MDISIQKVHEDSRGDIYSILLPQNQELMLFFCKAGYLRGGHSHSVPEVVLLLSGKLEYHKILDGREVVREKSPGDAIYNLAGEPHMARFLEDSWIVEFKIGARVGEWENIDYPPFREQVSRSMA